MNQNEYSSRVFIVHGRDDLMKESVARMVGNLDLDPIILHEQLGGGKTIIEKFTHYADVGFAIVILSPDDLGKLKADVRSKYKTRARQNVIFELGYFIGRLGRDRTIALYRYSKDFEMPTDYARVTYIQYDEAGAWKMAVAKELKLAGYSVDFAKL